MRHPNHSHTFASRDGRAHTILIVDDDPTVARALERELLRDGHSVCWVESAEAALSALAGQSVDLMLIDLELPGLDGIELASRVRLLHPDTVRFVLSGSRDFEQARRAINRGAVTHFASKPWNPTELRIEIALALDERDQREARKPAPDATYSPALPLRSPA